MKGYDLCLEAMARVRDELGSCPFLYRVAGDGPDQVALERKVAELGLDAHVEFVGWVEPLELGTFLGSGDVFVHPARWEPFGVAVIEAQAAGLPVVGSDRTAAVLDRVRDGVNGYVVPAGDVEALARALRRIHECRAMLPDMRAAARAAAEDWPASRNVDALLAIRRPAFAAP
jgi:1,4-alpha-glucan branching enzyme